MEWGNMVNVAVLGYGTIGSGVVEVLRTNADIVKKNAGDEISVKYVLDLKDLTETKVADIWTKDFNDILNDPEVDIVVEVMGGTGAAYTFVKASLEAGKSAVTSNKALVAAYGPELIRIAREKNCNFMFEASVGGGIPLIRPLQRCLTADDITDITGILNGTTNFILTKMYEEGSEFDATLKEAQALGYAEADPTADVEGYDTCRKIAILTALANGRFVDFNDFICKGITDITDIDIAYAKAMGRKIKLLGSSVKQNGKVIGMVGPFMLDPSSPLYAVDGVMNAVSVKGNMVGEVMFYGAGAGSLPTASAVVSDIIVEAQHLHENIHMEMEPEKLEISNADELVEKFFVRVKAGFEIPEGVMVTEIAELPEHPEEYAFVTAPISANALKAALGEDDNIIKFIKIK